MATLREAVLYSRSAAMREASADATFPLRTGIDAFLGPRRSLAVSGVRHCDKAEEPTFLPESTYPSCCGGRSL